MPTSRDALLHALDEDVEDADRRREEPDLRRSPLHRVQREHTEVVREEAERQRQQAEADQVAVELSASERVAEHRERLQVAHRDAR
ncbi:hypothetical protein [Microbacterium sp. H83]|uniref:hypothetical protein n=1 Tax=Microbacterium sp. H83 TaxID=1827324 RepID=UPI0012FC4BF5|nr:hypothetical protein [Microbacterium sp. H83]